MGFVFEPGDADIVQRVWTYYYLHAYKGLLFAFNSKVKSVVYLVIALVTERRKISHYFGAPRLAYFDCHQVPLNGLPENLNSLFSAQLDRHNQVHRLAEFVIEVILQEPCLLMQS